jgi:hypothetical protein
VCFVQHLLASVDSRTVARLRDLLTRLPGSSQPRLPGSLALDQPYELPNLVGLGLAAYRLQIDQLWDIRMHEDVVAAADPPQLEAQSLGESAKVAKRNIGHVATGEPLEELAQHGSPQQRRAGKPPPSLLATQPLHCDADGRQAQGGGNRSNRDPGLWRSVFGRVVTGVRLPMPPSRRHSLCYSATHNGCNAPYSYLQDRRST